MKKSRIFTTLRNSSEPFDQKSSLFFKWYIYTKWQKIIRVIGFFSVFLAISSVIWTNDLRPGIIIIFWLGFPSFLLYYLFQLRIPIKKRSLVMNLILSNGENDLNKIVQLIGIPIEEVISILNKEIIHGYLQGEIIENKFHHKEALSLESILSPVQIQKLREMLEVKKRIRIEEISKQLGISKGDLLDFLYQDVHEGKLAIILNEEESALEENNHNEEDLTQ